MTKPIAPAVHQAEFLTSLFADLNGSLIEVRLFEDREHRDGEQEQHADVAFAKTVEQVLENLPKSRQQQYSHGVFVGVCPRINPKDTTPKGTKAFVKEARWLWADVDGKDFPGGKTEALKRIQAFPLPVTMLVDTGHGYHAYWRLKEPVPTDTDVEGKAFEDYLKRLCISLGGDWAVCERSRVMRLPGTWNLKDPANPLLVRLIELDPRRSYDLEEFEKVLPSLQEQQVRAFNNTPGWIAEVLRGLREGTREDCHTAFGKVIGKLIQGGLGEQDILELLGPHLEQVAHQDHRFSVEDLREEVKDMARRYAATTTSGKASMKGLYTAQFDGLVDIVAHQGRVMFLVKEHDKLLILPEVERDGTLYVPPPRDQIDWLLPRGEEVLTHYSTDSDARLYDDLLTYHTNISELPSEDYYDLLVAWDMHTYLLEAFQYSPMIWFYAVPERGKTRTGKGMIYAAYRGLHDETLREPYLARVADYFQASVFFDVLDIWKKAEKHSSEDILLNRYERGGSVVRVLYPDRGRFKDMVRFTVFGPTVIATNVGVPLALESRAVQINMPEATRHFEQDVTPELALPLKERLVAFRARHLAKPLPDLPKPAKGRLGDILKPLVQVIRLVRPEREDAFRRLIVTLAEERHLDKADSLDARLVEIIRQCAAQVDRGKLTVKAITETYNTGKAEREHLNEWVVGRKLKALGFQKTRTNTGAAAILWEEEKLNRLSHAYGLQDPSPTLQPLGEPRAGQNTPPFWEGWKNPLDDEGEAI